jgi:hypothetical protein
MVSVSAIGWVALVIVSVTMLFMAGAVGAVSICLELALDEQTASPHAQGKAAELLPQS